VQEAIQKLMESEAHTVIVIAHRLSTIRSAQKIAFISDGKVKEFGTHEELLEKPGGRYQRLVESSKRQSTLDSVGLNSKKLKIEKITEEEEEDEVIDWDAEIHKKEKAAFNAKRARQLAKPDAMHIFTGSVGALMVGSVFPVMGVLFG